MKGNRGISYHEQFGGVKNVCGRYVQQHVVGHKERTVKPLITDFPKGGQPPYNRPNLCS